MRAVRLLVLAVALAAGAPARAQTPDQLVQRDCDVDVVSHLDPAALPAPWSGAHPNVVRARFRDRLARGEWAAVSAELARDFRGSRTVPPGPMRTTFQAELDSMASEFRAVASSADFATLVRNADGVRQVRFHLARDVRDDSDAWRFMIFDPPMRIVLDAGTDADARRDLCWRAITAERLLILYGAPGRQRTAAALEALIGRWENYNHNGYSQYPWELVVNGLSRPAPADLAPPARQIVLLHPSFGVEVAGRWDQLQRLDVLAVEPLGLLWYNASRTSYVGVSALVTVPSTAGMGVGALVHLGRVARVGYVVRRAVAPGVHRNGVMMSIDAYRLAAGVPGQLRGVVERLRALKDEMTGPAPE